MPDPAARHRRAVVLIGMMGAGKTTVGARLARRLEWRFVDNDLAVVEQTGKSIPEIFQTEGEDAFRAVEAESIRAALSSGDDVVLSVGGGAVSQPTTREALQAPGVEVVWLKAPVEVLIGRVARRSADRPMIAGDDPAAAMRRLYAEREATYASVATRVVDVAQQSPDAIARRLARTFEQGARGGSSGSQRQSPAPNSAARRGKGSSA